jgi:alpha-galactosidase
LKASPNEGEIAFANVVKPEEMEEGRRFLAEMLDNLTVTVETGYVPADVTCVSQGWGTLQQGRSVSEEPLMLAQRSFRSGLGTHADSEIRVRLPAGAKRLTGWCGINDTPGTRAHSHALVFSVEAGGKELWRSGEQRVADEPARVDIQLGGCRELTLRVKGQNISWSHAVWADMKATLTTGKTALIGGSSPVETGFRFRYGGVSSENLLPAWSLKKQRLPEQDGVILHRITRADPKTGLALICEIKEYTRFPVVEWGLRFKNTAKKPTPILEAVRSLDITRNLGQYPYLNHWTGDYLSADGYEPFRSSLAHGEAYHFAPGGGRPTDCAFPYYNLECPTTQRGLIVVVGWSGQWSAAFQGHGNQSIHVTAGQELTHFKLLPGEEARTPLSVLMFYRGDRARSRNLWRRWFLAHNMPRPGGELMKPHLACAATDEGEEFTAATEENQVRYISQFNQRGIKPDVWWIDAGWYPCYDENRRRCWWRTGTWEPDPERFPRGLKPVSDHAAKAGADLLVWFEPERVFEGSKLFKERPEWLLWDGANAVTRLLDLGNPKCRRWLTNHVCRMIRENGIKIYRQDFNCGPLGFWRKGEAADRQGMTENLYVQGYLQYWKDLLARNPGLWIDSCASGGRRNDLETLRLAVPLHYSDYGYGDPPVKLAFHSALFEWIPYFKEFSLAWDRRGNSRFDHEVDRFAFHCGMAPMLFATLDIRRDDYDFALASKMIDIWRRIADLMLQGDYYPLTPYHRSADQWVAWQFDRPEEGRGFIQGIRLPAAVPETLTVCPRGLQAEAVYRFENPETGETRELTGAALQEQGFAITLPKRAGAIWMYQQIDFHRSGATRRNTSTSGEASRLPATTKSSSCACAATIARRRSAGPDRTSPPC